GRHVLWFYIEATAPTDHYTLSLHDALPIWSSAKPAIFSSPTKLGRCPRSGRRGHARLSRSTCRWSTPRCSPSARRWPASAGRSRSEEHTSELQSQSNLVCRLLLEKKNILTSSERLRTTIKISRPYLSLRPELAHSPRITFHTF